MNELSKKLLNYYATFTETKFNFSRLISYRWSQDELSTDLGVYPDFTKMLIDIATNSDKNIVVKKGQFVVKIGANEILTQLNKCLDNDFSARYLDNCVREAAEKHKTIHIGNDGDAKVDSAQSESTAFSSFNEGARTFNLAFRKQFAEILSNAHNNKLNDLKSGHHLEDIPNSTFNQRSYVQTHFDKFQTLANKNVTSETYITNMKLYLEKNIQDITIYDLYFTLNDFMNYTGLGTLFAFFHSITNSKAAYPLYFLEIEMRLNPSKDEVELTIPRDVTLINTPAINAFKFDNVLTLPRSSTRGHAFAHLHSMQTFLQTIYKVGTSFMHESSFDPILAEEEKMPSIFSRVGLQIIKNEDKKLLDYSELHARVEEGKSSQFSTFINQYIEGKIPNYQEETDETYRQLYPRISPSRFIHDSPIPLNASQKRILTAVANDKNKVIVVDGPPGTGKSHTIAGITYWANQNKKSLVITSHKKEALDVIERMLDKKFKSLHPNSKPSILRLSQGTQSQNSISNTLASPVITAASDRNLEENIDAINADLETQLSTLTASLKTKIEAQKHYEQYLADTINLEKLAQQLCESKVESIETILNYPKLKVELDLGAVLEVAEIAGGLSANSIQEIRDLLPLKGNIENILSALELLDEHHALDNATAGNDLKIPKDFTELIIALSGDLASSVPVVSLDANKDLLGGRIAKFKKRKDISKIQEQVEDLLSIRFASLISQIANEYSVEKKQITLRELRAAVTFAEKSQKNQNDIDTANLALDNNVFFGKKPHEVYDSLQLIAPLLKALSSEKLLELEKFFLHYSFVLEIFGIKATNLKTLSLLEDNETLTMWLELHGSLSIRSEILDLQPAKDPHRYQFLAQKVIEHRNDDRLRQLNNHVNEIAQIKQRYEKGRRFSEDQAQLLLDSISVIIAEPSMISKYFPMSEELFDMLVVDESSQVSIADSISVMLRSKQVIVFGDEYQYGAVSAQNVSTKYSSSYFKEIINAYKDGYCVNISSDSEKQLLDSLQNSPSDEELSVQSYEKPDIDQGTIDWLKTFDIRTSTLTFTKAIANYSTSLKEHFRSFPEIIAYSNEFFYKQAQMELTVNRIRTQPITQTLVFEQIETKGKTGANINLDEIIFIAEDIKKRIANGFKGSIGIITSFREQQIRLEEYIQEHFNYRQLQKEHDLAVWFVRDVQGEERDLVYYSFTEDKKLGNADLKTIYPVVGGVADSPRSIKMQQLNVGFSRAKDTMIFVHSMPITNYSSTRLGDALKFYKDSLAETEKVDHFIADTNIFDSPQEEYLYKTILQTDFYGKNKEYLHIVPQFEIGKYIKAEYAAQIPKYRADFLVTLTINGTQNAAIMEYDGIEFHYKNPSEVTAHKLSQEFTEYDIARQLELESYGYRFIRINKFTLRADKQGKTDVEMLSEILEETFKK